MSRLARFNGWVGEGYIILDPTTGAGAYKIAGGGNGGAGDYLDSFGVSDIFGLAFSLMDFATGIGSYKEASFAMKKLSGIISGIFKGLGTALSLIVGIFDIYEKCGSVNFGALAVLSVGLIMILSIGFIEFTPAGKIMGFLINSIITSISQTVLNLALNIAKDDCRVGA